MSATVLVTKRGRVLRSITLAATFAENINEETTIEDIETRLRKLDSWWEEFCNLEDELLSLPQQTSKYDEFETKFFNVQASLTRELKKRNPTIKQDPVNDELNATINNIYSQQRAYFESLQDKTMNQEKALKLPRINILHFNGEYTQWPSFKDLYEAAVHKNDSISRIHKFQLLRSVLEGSAARLIQHFLLTDANYDEAWQKLQRRYDNKRSIISTIIQRFIDQPTIKRISSNQLRTLAETSDDLLRGLKALGPDSETRDPWVLHLLVNKLDEQTRQQWALHSVDRDLPTVDFLLEFLHRRCDALESCNVTPKSNKQFSRQSYIATANTECLCCKKPHQLHKCYKFQGFDIEHRKTFVNNLKLCVNCLREGHSVDNCISQNTCFKCKSKHHTLLHVFNNTADNKQLNSNVVSTSSNSESTKGIGSRNSTMNAHTTTKIISSENKQTILPTVVMMTRDTYGQIHKVRALLDSGSESLFITETLTKKLGLKRSHACLSVNGLSSISAGTTRGLITIKLCSKYNPQQFIVADALILKTLTTHLPSRTISLNSDEISKMGEYGLADPEFYVSNPIDMIIGIDIFYDVIMEKRISFGPSLHLLDSIFGWVVAGSIDNQLNSVIRCNTIRMNSEDIHKLLQRFWEVEENAFEMPTKEDSSEEHFLRTHKFVSGRYEVELPFKTNSEQLGNTLKQAKSRVIAMERKFLRDPQLKSEYVKFMREYENLGHMERISDFEICSENHFVHYLPHHAVIKRSSTTSKLRVVFDGSCRSDTGLSLNDVLITGSTIQDDLFSILTRFRKHKIAIVSDIEKMYRQIMINPKHQEYQRILWRENSSKLHHFRLKTVTYGLTCSAYLAIRSLQQAAIDNKEITSKLLSIIKSDFYVDDLLTGCDSVDEAVALYNNISKILSHAGFSLRQWTSNNMDFLSNIPSEKQGKDAISIEDPESYVKTLGICWLTKDDHFTFNVPDLCTHQITKRRLLSECGKLFDPLGWLSPVTITFKIILQSLWLTKLEWDDPVPEEINRSWCSIRDELSHLTAVRIPRFLQMCNVRTVQYHGFCDASEKAYSAVVYTRVVHNNGDIFIRLIASKTKVSPLKQLSIPRLELCGAVLLTKLLGKIATIFDAPTDALYAWTDSTIVLSWLSDVPRKWNCFVANQTSFIIEKLSRNHWQHVPTNMNPADCASRGLSPMELLKHRIWWDGPIYLMKLETEWPNYNCAFTEPTNIEKRITVLLTKKENSNNSQTLSPVQYVIERYSSYTAMLRTLSNCYRFSEICHNHKTPYITGQHLMKSEHVIIKCVQNEVFYDEIHMLKNNQSINRSSKLISLHPFLDDNDVLRVGGRLHCSSLRYSMKHPAILPRQHTLVDKLLRYLHSKYLHPNPSALLFITRRSYWILGAKEAIKRISNSCVQCTRTHPRLYKQMMGNLPDTRVTLIRAFTNVGVDYAGPVTISSKKGRGSKRLKAYICLFICMATKAMHIELVGDLSTDAFTAALRRFVGRRGLPKTIYSDNATNFAGARRKCDEIYGIITSRRHNETVAAYLGTHQIEWHTIPPSAPHFGGLWEAGVKSVKTHIRRVLGESAPTSDELHTLLIQIEAIVNSRPLTPLNEDVDDMNILTPGHFLIGVPLLAVPDATNTEGSVRLNERWQLVQNMARGFWKRWHAEYLTMLQRRSKWQHQERNLKEGELVLIKEDNLSPLSWARGRITKLYPGKDGIVRVVSIKTANGELKRPIVKLCKLPVE